MNRSFASPVDVQQRIQNVVANLEAELISIGDFWTKHGARHLGCTACAVGNRYAQKVW